MKAIVSTFIILFLSFTVQSAYSIDAESSYMGFGTGGDVPSPDSTGGPDAYGYTWIDSDEPGGPTYDWVDITGVGTLVAGLGDDNSVGPFAMGFSFPYYWYDVDQFYVGSNGWISFSSGQNFAHPFAQLPHPPLPNDLLAGLSGDIDFTQGGSCYYYTSSGLDSLIVSYIEVPEFASGTALHTFQIILTRADSTITYQYGEQLGDFSAGGSNAFSMGIENNTGTIGLNYYYNPRTVTPPSPPPFAESTVIKFIPPEVTTYEVHDLGVPHALTVGGMGMFIHPSSTLSNWSVIKNFGNQAENFYAASCVIEDDGGSVVFSDSILYTTTINPGDVESVDFPDFSALQSGVLYTAGFGSHLPPGIDMVPGNDYMDVEVLAVDYPGELSYDDGSNESNTSWNGDFSGFGNQFVPPSYPVKLDHADVMIGSSSTMGDMVLYVLDDDGPDGGPGTILAGDTISVSSPGWRSVDLSSFNVVIYEGSFYVGAIHRFQSTFTFGMDENPPLSRRGWEYTAGWAPSRYQSENDIMIRVEVIAGPPPHHAAPVQW
jgi:hypothetical protein